MSESGFQKALIVVGLVLVLMIGVLIAALYIMRREIRGGVKEGVQTAAEHKIDEGVARIEREVDELVAGGGKPSTVKLDYAKKLEWNVEAERRNRRRVDIRGTVRNTGDKAVTFLRVCFMLLDKEGVQVASETEYLAHSLPFGDNNAPILPGMTKCFTDDSWDRHWQGGSVNVHIIEIATKD